VVWNFFKGFLAALIGIPLALALLALLLAGWASR
jgi:hypothetical protein